MPVSAEDDPVVAGTSQENPTPVVDELGNVDRPVHLRHVSKDGAEEIVEDDLSVEADDQIVDLSSGVEILGQGGQAHVAGFGSRWPRRRHWARLGSFGTSSSMTSPPTAAAIP